MTERELVPANASEAVRSALQRLPTLPDVPGGWSLRTHRIADKQFELWIPAQPEKFLDDPDVLEANRLDDYMPYWSQLWPTAGPMSLAVLNAPWPPGTEILELGAGVGLVGLSAVSRGDRVVFTDYDATSVLVCRHNVVRNGFTDPPAERLDWRRPWDRQFDVILGSDVTYEAKNHPILLELLSKMLTPNGVCWIGDPGRYHTTAFYQLALDRGFRVKIRDESGRESAFPSPRNFQIFELTRSNRI